MGNTDLFAGTTDGIFHSTNNGSHWTKLSSFPPFSWVNTMIVKGSHTFYGDNHGVFLSTDNGTTWFVVNNGLTDTIVNAFAVSGKNVFAGTNGGVFLSTNNGTSWSAVSPGLTDTVIYSLAVNDSFLFAGTESTGVWRRPLSEISPKVNCESIVSNGWNLVSVPLRVNDLSKMTLFPTAVSDAFAYQGSYIKKDTLNLGSGYWIRFDHNQTVSMTGDFITPESIAVVKGWNLIGSFGDSVQVSMIGSNIPGMITSSFFGYKNGYIVIDSILPANGYWVKTDTDGYLIYQADHIVPVTNRIHIVATKELPPPPPSEQGKDPIPKQYALEQAYPSPFNPNTTIEYSLPENSNVRLTIYNLLGQTVAILQDGMMDAGNKQVSWNAGSFASGIYFYRLEAISVADPTKVFTQVRKTVLLK